MGAPKKTQNKAVQSPKKAKKVEVKKCKCGYENEANRTRCYACNQEL